METRQFSDFDLSPEMMRGICRMGFSITTPVQSMAIEPMMQRKDQLVQAPTGTGKTCAFGIPAIENIDAGLRKIQMVVLCPTRELALQTSGVLRGLTAYIQGVQIATLYGGEPIARQINTLRKHPQIIVATPGRMMDHMRRRTVRLEHVNLVVLDEADRMLDMGFREDMKTILSETPAENRQTVLFSATLSNEIKKIASEYQKEPELIRVKQNIEEVGNVKQFYTEIAGKRKTSTLISLLYEKKFSRPLIFVATKRAADEVSQELRENGFRSAALHGGLLQRKRDTVMDSYRKGAVSVLVATDVAARGLDVNGIDAVINYDIPGDTDSYVHRIGRTGRGGKCGVAYTLLYPKERGMLDKIMVTLRTKILPVKGIQKKPHTMATTMSTPKVAASTAMTATI
jgi:ATP-dependent RNA helicase DeaD